MARTANSLNRKTESMLRALHRADGSDLLAKIAFVANDDSLPFRLQVDAVRLLAGAIYGGRIRLHDQAKQQVAESLELQN
jgi:hypothetical protein